MNYNEAISYIHSVSNFFCKPGLERIGQLCSLLGNPQEKLKFIHVAGTNGKGSFSAMTASVLTAAGYKTGLYTSPYITKFNERIAIDGNMISDNELAKLTDYVKQFAETLDDKPTEFELITAIAFEYFYRSKCDYVVLECGLGGKFDATNIISTTVLSVITGVSIDHTDFLGKTVLEIAGEKAGIIKPKVPCLWCGNDQTALSIIKEKATANNSPLYFSDKNDFKITNYSLDGTYFDYGEYKNVFIKLLGSFQPINAVNVIRAVELLKNAGLDISKEHLYTGLKNTIWHARFEVLNKNPIFISDGGHNPEGVCAAVDSIKLYFKSKKVFVVTGVMKDKDYFYIADKIGEVAEKVFCVTPNNPRALKSGDFCTVFREKGIAAKAYDNIDEAVKSAVETAIKSNMPVISLGSLYMYGDIKNAVKKYFDNS